MTRKRNARRARLGSATLVCISVGLFGGAAPALADDASVLRAWERNDRQFAALGREAGRAVTTFDRTRRAGPLLGVIARTRALIVKTRNGVIAEQPSTATGGSARLAAVRSLAHFYRSLGALRSRVLASVRGDRRAAMAHGARAEAEAKRSEAQARLAVSLFRQAGLSPAGAT